MTDDRAAQLSEQKQRYFPMVLTVAGAGDVVIGLFFAILGPSLLGGGDAFLEQALVVIGALLVLPGLGLIVWGRRRARANAESDPRRRAADPS